jgi:hypothetical protein
LVKLAQKLSVFRPKGGEILMTMNNRYAPFAVVALITSVIGWSASAWTNREQTVAQTLPTNNAALGFQPNAQAPLQLTPQAIPQGPVAPVTYAAVPMQPVAQAPQVVTVREAAAPVVRTAPVRTNREVAANEAPVSTTNTRKKGMSNKAKTAIAIGGGAGLGAAIGGIAKGGKGAAIGALIGAGTGTVYSVIRHKQNKPVF